MILMLLIIIVYKCNTSVIRQNNVADCDNVTTTTNLVLFTMTQYVGRLVV